MEQELSIDLKITLNHAKTLMAACEIVARLYMRQFDVLQYVHNQLSWEDIEKIQEICTPGPPHTRYKAIHSHDLPDEARQLWDLYQVLRHFLAWREEENTPETRDWSKQMGVMYDDPWRTSEKCPLPEIEEKRQSSIQPKRETSCLN